MVVILIQISSDQGFLEPSGAVPAGEGSCKYPEPRAVLFLHTGPARRLLGKGFFQGPCVHDYLRRSCSGDN